MTEPFNVKAAIASAVSRAEQDTPKGYDVSPLTIRAQQGQGMVEMGRLSGNLNQVSEGFALMGEFEEAMMIATGARLEEYRKIATALAESAPCSCAKHLGSGTKRTPTSFIKDKFLRRGVETNLHACVTCGKYWTT